MWRALIPAAAMLAVMALPSPPALPTGLDEIRPEIAPLPDAATLRDAPRSLDELRARVAEVLARERVPGVGLALVDRDGRIWSGGVGVADLASGRPVDADTVFRIASITKSFVGLGVMRLVEQGRLSLDRPLRETIGEAGIVNPWDAVAPVTLAQVLEHTAGLDDMRPNEVFTEDGGMSPTAALTINPRSRQIRWQPGTRFSYSNVGYTLAARAIEVATGEPFDAWLRREVLGPLGMRDADFRLTTALAPHLATGYDLPGRPAPFRPIAHRGAGALLASPRELAQAVLFWLRRGDGYRIVSPAGLDRAERSGTLPYPHVDLEYGLGNYCDVSLPVRSHGHNGGLPGFSSSMRYFPELGRGYVVLLNATFSWRALLEIEHLVFAYLTYDRTLPPPPPAGPPVRPGAAFFGFASPRNELFAFVDRALLGWTVTPTGQGAQLDPLIGPPLAIVPTADGGYRFPGQSGSSVRFTETADGTPVMVGGFGYAEAAPGWFARVRLTAIVIAVRLLELAPIWAIAIAVLAAIRRRRVIAPGLLVWPAVAGACFVTLPILIGVAALRQELGEVHASTIAVCATSCAFALAAIAAVVSAARWTTRPDRPPLAARVVPSAMAIAAAGLALWLGAHGMIALRTWAW